jgi:DNA-binding response OmpR family regulator
MGSLKVLLVDDEEEFASALAERLQLRGFHVQIANDGEAALACLKADPPQVVVLDLKMPGLGGVEVLRQMRSHHPQIPVILLSGLSSTRPGSEETEFGEFDYLVKPVEIEVLVQKILEAAGSAS